MPRRIDGNNALYHYIQKAILPREDGFAHELVRRLILDLSIWFPIDLFAAAPVLLPFCVRDASVKSKEWGSASPEGYLRDNNSALKLLVSSYTISSPLTAVYARHGRGRNFTASHCWRKIYIDGDSRYATTHPRTYSFIPNLTWLPAQVAKLTDHEGSYAQRILQRMAHHLYRSAAEGHPPGLVGIWNALPMPGLEPDLEDEITRVRVNFFEVSARSIKMRRNILLRECELVLLSLEKGTAAGPSPRSFRYLPSLVRLPREDCDGLAAWMEEYRDFLLHG